MYDWCMIRCFCASTYKLYHGKMMILCKHGLTEINMIYCIANQPKTLYLRRNGAEKCQKVVKTS